MSMQHPDGWLYFFHPIHRVIVDACQEPFDIPSPVDEDEEIHRHGLQFVRVSHVQQSLPTTAGDNAARRDYWSHIAQYPSHHSIYVRKALLRAREEALLYLRWCSLGKSVAVYCRVHILIITASRGTSPELLAHRTIQFEAESGSP